MSWETHPAKASFAKYAADWDRLNGELHAGHPYFDSRFIGPLLDCFACGTELLCLRRKNGVISAALILQPDGMGRWLLFRPSQAQASAILLTTAGELKTLFPALPGFAWSIELHAIDPRYAPDFSEPTLVTIISAHARTIGIDGEMRFQDYWEARPKNLRANLRRYFNRSEKEYGPGTPVLRKLTGHEAMEAAVSRFGRIETAGWKGAAGTAVGADNPQGRFYSRVLAGFALSNQAAVYELHVGEQLAASRLVISCAEMLVILKTTYDETLARFAPGRIQLYQLIREQLDGPAQKTIEFYTDATRDQAEWATFDCTVKNIQAFRNEAWATVFLLLKCFRRSLRSADHRRLSVDEQAAENIKEPAAGSAVVASHASLESLASAGYADDALQEFAAHDTIEASLDWFDLLQQNVYPNDPGVRYYLIAENLRPTTILPLRLTVNGRILTIRTIQSLGNYYTSLYTPLLAKGSDPLSLRRLLAAAVREHGGAHVMRFSPMDPQSPAFSALQNELRAMGWVPFRYFCFGNWFLKVEGSWAEYLKKRSGNLRSTIKRMSTKFAAEGGTLETVTAAATEDLDQAIADFQEVYTASWKVPEPYPAFVPSLIRRLAANGMLRLGIARLHGRPIAAQLWIVGATRASIYKVAYHQAFAAHSPGTVLTAHLLQHVIDVDQVSEVDFLIGDDKYKQVWMSDRRERWGIVAYNPRSLIGFALFVREASARMVKAAIWRIRLLRFARKPARPGRKGALA